MHARKSHHKAPSIYKFACAVFYCWGFLVLMVKESLFSCPAALRLIGLQRSGAAAGEKKEEKNQVLKAHFRHQSMESKESKETRPKKSGVYSTKRNPHSKMHPGFSRLLRLGETHAQTGLKGKCLM